MLTAATKESVPEEELLETMETDDRDRLRRMLEADVAGKLRPTIVPRPGVDGTAAGAAEGGDDGSDQDGSISGFYPSRGTARNMFNEDDFQHIQFVESYTLLHIAARYGAVQCVDLLLQTEGFQPDVYSAEYDGGLPLHWAVARNKPEVVDRLVGASCRLDIADCLGRTALHIACSKGFLACVEALLKAETDTGLNSTDPQGFTPLMSTMLRRKNYYRLKVKGVENSTRHVEIMRKLISAGAKLNMASKSGFTALHLAVHLAPFDSFVDCLLNSDVNVNQRSTQSGIGLQDSYIYGLSPLWIALARSHLTAARKLIIANADLNLCCRTGNLQAYSKQENVLENMQKFTSREFLGVDNMRDVFEFCSDGIFEEPLAPFGIAVALSLFKFAVDIVRSGYIVSRHETDWFRNRLRRPHIGFQSVSNPFGAYTDEKLNDEKLVDELTMVRPLQWWCRRCVRHRLPQGLHRIQTAVKDIGLPTKIQSYLLLVDVFPGTVRLDTTDD